MRGDSCFVSNNHTLSCMLKADTCFLLPPTPAFPAWLPQTLCFLLDRQRCRWPCELAARGGSPHCRCVRTFDGLWRPVCAGTGWSPAW